MTLKRKVKPPNKTLLKKSGQLDTGFSKWLFEKGILLEHEIPATKDKWNWHLQDLYKEYLLDSYEAQT